MTDARAREVRRHHGCCCCVADACWCQSMYHSGASLSVRRRAATCCDATSVRAPLAVQRLYLSRVCRVRDVYGGKIALCRLTRPAVVSSDRASTRTGLSFEVTAPVNIIPITMTDRRPVPPALQTVEKNKTNCTPSVLNELL